jgi:hypothetical protein
VFKTKITFDRILQFDGVVIIYIAQFRTSFKVEVLDIFFSNLLLHLNIEVGWF